MHSKQRKASECLSASSRGGNNDVTTPSATATAVLHVVRSSRVRVPVVAAAAVATIMFHAYLVTPFHPIQNVNVCGRGRPGRAAGGLIRPLLHPSASAGSVPVPENGCRHPIHRARHITLSHPSSSQRHVACSSWRKNSLGGGDRPLCSAKTDSAEAESSSATSIPGGDDDSDREEGSGSSENRGAGCDADDASRHDHSAVDGFNASLRRATSGNVGHGDHDAAASSGRAESVVTRAVAAEGILDRMEAVPSSSSEVVTTTRPDSESCNIVLRAWNDVVDSLSSPEGCPITGMTALEAAERAERLLRRMEGEGSVHHHPPEPTAESYDLVAEALVHSRTSGAAERIEALMGRMVERGIRPDARTYEALIDAWAASPFRHAALRAEGALHRVEGMYLEEEMERRKQLSSSGESSEAVDDDAGDEAKRKGGDGNIRPTMHMYKSVLRAWSHHEDRHEAARRSDELLRHMNELRSPSKKREPNDIRIIDFPPDTPCYTAVIDAWRNSDVDESAVNAQRVFDRLRKAGLRPYANTYTSVLQAWSNRAKYDDEAPLRAEELLERMERYSRIGEKSSGGDDDDDGSRQQSHVAYRPNVITYTSVINAWARSSRDDEKAPRALRLLKRMNELLGMGEEQVRPNLYTYNSVINACATCHGADSARQRHALKIAFAVLKALDRASSSSPRGAAGGGGGDGDDGRRKVVVVERANHITYGTLLKAAANLLPMGDARRDVVRATFTRCAREGQVDEGVIKQFRLSADRELFYEILGEAAMRGRNFRHGEVDMSSLPAEWTRKCPKVE